MSGGAFDYNQRLIADIADGIEDLIKMNGAKKTEEELKDQPWKGADWYKEFPEELYRYKYPDEVVEEFKNAAKYLRIAYVYAQRIDWLISGDDGEESFLERLKEELDKL
jgi:hypothetical protein